MNRYALILFAMLMSIIMPSFAAAERKEGEEIRERLIRIEERMVTREELKAEIRDVRTEIKEVRTEIKDVRTEIRDLRTEIKDVGTEIKQFMLWGFGILFGGMGILIGFVIWDRRTALAPVIKKYKELEDREELIEKALREYAKTEPKLAEILKKGRLI